MYEDIVRKILEKPTNKLLGEISKIKLELRNDIDSSKG